MKQRKKRSAIWLMPVEEFKELVRDSDSLATIIKHFNFVTSHGNYRTLKKRLAKERIDYSHIKMGRNSNHGRRFPSKAIPLKEVMIRNSTYSRGCLKRRLIKDRILEEKCSICGIDNNWEGEPLVMVLDHRNGVNNDHRLENLRLLCPNCNSQTPTFSGKQKSQNYYCNICGKKITKYSKTGKCIKCVGIESRKVKRPLRDTLEKEVKKLGYVGTGKKYKVSDNTIRKWLR